MPNLVWDETEVMSCLEVAPLIEEYEISYCYTVEKESIRLSLGICPMESSIYVSIWTADSKLPLIDFRMIDCGGIKHRIADQTVPGFEIGSEVLEFVPGQVFGNRFQNDFVIPTGFRLSVKPSVSLRFF